ncbi:hypothetical protein BVG16_08690 [Paenibacillus selenitireducens]|uniref:Linalool dehydratase/isomerase domain-containing protein n=1 Tax=Paenibacillus selenitireducens TaxID=1324314 RepID=A0A1T2XHL9_9BACL|nr:hypothetical protein [Paenibacillus selenitireducens]OPA79163.1 hypothetical protein BVG16_08690 [Paenibacillus selenitireducens]
MNMIRKVGEMPNIPSPFLMRDWNQVAQHYDALVFDFEAKGDFLPFIWWDRSRSNEKRDTFGLPSYVGMDRGESGHEAINCVAALLGATLVGRDKSNQNSVNWVSMCENYYNTDNGEFLFLNSTRAESGRSFWYEIYPHVLLYSLSFYYPGLGRLDEIMHKTADRWYEACYELGGKNGIPDFNHLSYNFQTKKPVDNGKWVEPEAAAGIAWLEYMAYSKWKDPKHLTAADWCMSFLEQSANNPFYEILLPYGAYIAARMNAELGRDYDVQKLINWCFDGDSHCRKGWGVISERWGDYDCHGLCGSLTDWGQRWDLGPNPLFDEYKEDSSGYAFAANTFSLAAAFIPLVRYDTRFAKDIGKWMLNAANNARLFYPDALPKQQQSCAFYRSDPNHVIAYEGLRKKWDDQSPYMTGDGIRYSWGCIDLGLYGSSHVGIFGGIISQTNDPCILQLDCLKTDYFRDEAYPTYLYYNPYDLEKTVLIDVGQGLTDIYDAVSHVYIQKGARGETSLTLPPDSAVVVVLSPAEGSVRNQGVKRLVNDVVVDYNTTM